MIRERARIVSAALLFTRKSTWRFRTLVSRFSIFLGKVAREGDNIIGSAVAFKVGSWFLLAYGKPETPELGQKPETLCFIYGTHLKCHHAEEDALIRRMNCY